jgi:hypothetical protein
MGLDPAVEPEASAVTVKGAPPDGGVTASAAAGGAVAVAAVVADAEMFCVSVTVTLT